MRTDQLYGFVDNISRPLLEQTGTVSRALAEEVAPMDATLSGAMIEWIGAREAVTEYLALRGEGQLVLGTRVADRETVTRANFADVAHELFVLTTLQLCGFMDPAGQPAGTVHARLQNMADTLDGQLSDRLMAWYDAAFPVRLHILRQRRIT